MNRKRYPWLGQTVYQCDVDVKMDSTSSYDAPLLILFNIKREKRVNGCIKIGIVDMFTSVEA